MDVIISKIAEGMKRHNFRFKIVSIKHLPEIQNTVGDLVRQGMISEELYRRWRFYRKSNDKLPGATSIIIVAMPQFITRIIFKWQGVDYRADIPPQYFSQPDDYDAETTLKRALKSKGCKLVKADLALKTLAVRSGLADYGRNNITYVPCMGSFLRLIAFYTDYPYEEDTWRELQTMKICEKCLLCRKSCPTGCIPNDRFLIHAENCLTHLNEAESDFPQWLKPDWHNALIGCMRCQSICPVNKPFINKMENGPTFSEDETKLILDGIPAGKFGSETRIKLDRLIRNEIYPLMRRNLWALIDKQKKARAGL